VFIFSSLAIRAVGKAAYYIINDVRRQFKENPGIMQGTSKPDYGSCVDIATKGALKEMVPAGLCAVLVPIAVGILLARRRRRAPHGRNHHGVLVALVFNTAAARGTTRRSSSKRGSSAAREATLTSAVVGDTVGDPFKDTAGPSLHVLIKLLSTLTLVLVSLFFVLRGGV